ncbi:MAG: IS30 family transposase [Pyrinomonadaceae bacterium]
MTNRYHHLTLEERTLIQTQLQLGFKPAAIAAGLNRPRSCITRELARNGWATPAAVRPVGRPPLAGGYCSRRANGRAVRLAAVPRVPRKLVAGNALWTRVTDGLRQGLSPEQIAGMLGRMNEPVRLSHETIYQAIYVMPRGVLRTEMISFLRFGHAKRRPRTRGQDRRGQIPNMTSIDQRPADIADRLVPGHWEGDHIKGKGNRSQVGTLVERKTLYVALVKLLSGTAEATAQGFATVLGRFDVDMLRSLTYDQGREMTRHEKLTQTTGIKVYFAHPHSPWERGINENTNGLLRQYLPKGSDLSTHSQQQLDDIAWKLNTRPRKSLAWKCPAELFLPKGAFDFNAFWSVKLPSVALEP